MGWGKGGASIGQGACIREGRLIQTIHPKGASIRYGAVILEWAFIRSFTVCLNILCVAFITTTLHLLLHRIWGKNVNGELRVKMKLFCMIGLYFLYLMIVSVECWLEARYFT